MEVDDDVLYTSDKRQAEGTEGYIGLLFSHLNRLSGMISNPELGKMSGNANLYIQMLISHVPDKEKRLEFRQNFKIRTIELKEEALKEQIERANEQILQIKETDQKERILKEAKKLKEEKITYLEMVSAMELLGDIFDFINLHIGITKQARISFDLNCSKCQYKIFSLKNNFEVK